MSCESIVLLDQSKSSSRLTSQSHFKPTNRWQSFNGIWFFVVAFQAISVASFVPSRGIHPTLNPSKVSYQALEVRLQAAPSSSSPAGGQEDENGISFQPEVVDLVATLPLLKARLREPNLTTKERQNILEQIDQAETAAELGVRRAQVEFYQAFSTQDFSKMKQVWTDKEDCECIHPGMAALKGRRAILQSWQTIFEAPGGQFDVEPAETMIQICGTMAVVRCIEQVLSSQTNGGNRLEAINIYRREERAWKMTLHMAASIVVL